MRCIVKNCFNTIRNTTNDIAFHRVPVDSRRELWLKSLKFTENEVPIKSFVCSKHFKDDYYFATLERRRLIYNAIPTEYLQEEQDPELYMNEPSCSKQQEEESMNNQIEYLSSEQQSSQNIENINKPKRFKKVITSESQLDRIESNEESSNFISTRLPTPTITEVKLDLNPIDIDEIIKLEVDEDLENSNIDSENVPKNNYKFEINQKFEECIKFLKKTDLNLSSNEFKKIAEIYELVKKLFIQIDINIKKISNHKKRIKNCQQKFRRSQMKLNEFYKFIKFIKKNKKLFSTEIKTYLKKHKIFKFHLSKMNNESDSNGSVNDINDTVNDLNESLNYSNESVNDLNESVNDLNEYVRDSNEFVEDANESIDNISEIIEEHLHQTDNYVENENNENLEDFQLKSISGKETTIFLEVESLICHNNLNDEEEENSQSNIISNFSVSFDSETESEQSYLNDDELFKVIPEETKYKRSYTKLSGGEYECNICQKVTPNHAGFLQHSISHEEQSLICDVCGRLFEIHLKCLIHTWQCRKNRNNCPKRKSIIKGGGIHSGIDFTNYTSVENCTTKGCTRKFVEKNFLYYQHLDFHRGIKPYSCNTCSRQFQYAYNLFAHLKAKSKCCLENCTLPEYGPKVKNYEELIELSTAEYKHTCETCRKKFETKFKLLEHENSHTKDKPYVCTCGANYNSLNYLRVHMRKSNCKVDLSLLPNYCANSKVSCRRRVKSSLPSAKVDGKVVIPNHSYICKECNNLEFSCYRKLKYHRVTKHMERIFECEECHKKFPSTATLKRHVRVHHVGAYKCDICKPEKLMKESQYRRHKAYFHNRNNLGLYQCRICEEQFDNNIDLIKHVKAACHTSTKRIPQLCIICNQEYKYLNFLNHFSESAHLELEIKWRKALNIDCLICFHCDAKIDRIPEYLKHLEIRHRSSGFKRNMQKLINKMKQKNNDKL